LVILPGLTCRFEPENDKIRHISVVTGTGEKIDGKKRRVLSRGDTWTILPDTTVELKNCEDIPLEIIQVRLTPGHDE